MARYRSTTGLLMLLAVVASTFFCTSGTPEEGLALTTMMHEWNVTFPTWIAGTDPCFSWENVLCTDGRVTTLNLTSTGISGILPKDIGQLSALDTLILNENNLHGELPDELALCKDLRYLDISDNRWDIEFPSVILNFRKLESLYASTAALKGRIPKEFYSMIRLKYLYLGNNTQLTGNLESFCQLTNLVNLTLWWTQIEDNHLPDKLALLTNLEYFSCHGCGLVGGLPESYGNLENLIDFNVRNNTLTGGIPDSYKRLTKMYNFRMDRNFILAPFPNWMFDIWPNLTYLYLSRNQFYGVPYNISHMETNFGITSWRVLRWDCNYLRGPEPCNIRGTNNCSATTNNNTRTAPEAGVSMFEFGDNCYDGTTVDYRQQVGYCHDGLTCELFYSQVVEQNACPVCPQRQDPVSGSTVADGCLCRESTDSGSGFSVGTTVGIVVGVSFIFSIVLAFVVYKRRKHFSFFEIFSNKREDFDANWEAPPGVHRFSVEELAKITSDFHDRHIIGAGGFGKVYVGTLNDGRMVAIKRASADSLQGHAEFRNEVTLLSRLHHRNLVKLEGFCAEKDFQVLVYEFMKKGNLATHLYGGQEHGEDTTPLPWYKRLEIACGVARGLEYLHSFAAPSVIHRDVKPSNILLDENMVAKLADFGISREFDTAPGSKNTHLSTRPAGTAGYLDPEYFLRRQLTTASDVYAFGVVLLELVTGQVAIDHSRDDEFNLIEWVKKRFKTAGIISIVDPTIADDYSKDAFTQMTELALRCASFSKDERPIMKEVLAALDPLMPETAKTPPTRSDSSFAETDWLLAKRELYHKFDITTSSTDSTMHSAATISDIARTLSVMEMTQEFSPR